MTERGYTVSWSIYTDARDAGDAVEQARSILADPYNIATVFIAVTDDGIRTVIDTEEGYEHVIVTECIYCKEQCFLYERCAKSVEADWGPVADWGPAS